MSEGFSCFPTEGILAPIFEETRATVVSPELLDAGLAAGWRHFGEKFFRYNFALEKGALCGVMPLRIPLQEFSESKSQRRVRRCNADAEVRVVPTVHNAVYDALFEKHRRRFRENIPDSLRDFLSASPSNVPCANVAIEVWLDGVLLAVSFMDVGAEATSSVYGMFEPAHADRSLGIFTLLLEIAHARSLGKRHHYLGYAYTVSSVYDYKKRFRGVEGLDWTAGWNPLPEDYEWSRTMEFVGVTDEPVGGR